MTITTNPVRNQYDAISGQTVFNYTFKIYSSTDLNVYLTPVGQVPDDSTDLITSYVVDPGTIENEDGGFLTLNTGAAAGDTLTIVSSIPYNRETDYQYNGDFRPATVNNDIDRVVSLVKQNAGDLLRAVLAPESSDLENPIRIPSPENGKGLKWENNNLANTAIVETVTTDTSGTELITVSGNDVSVKGLVGSTSILLTDLGDTIRIDAISPAGGNVRTNGDNTYDPGTTQTIPRLIVLGVNIGEELLAQGVIQAQLAIDVQTNAASAQAASNTASAAQSTANAADARSIANLAEINAMPTPADYITSKGGSGNKSWRIWSSGKVEQWGRLETVGSNPNTVSLPVPMPNISFVMNASYDDSGSGSRQPIYMGSQSNSTFTFRAQNNTTISWYIASI